MHGDQKYPKIKVKHQMDDAISLDSTSQATIFKQKDCVEKKLSRKAKFSFTLGATGNHVASHDAKSPASKTITFSTRIL